MTSRNSSFFFFAGDAPAEDERSQDSLFDADDEDDFFVDTTATAGTTSSFVPQHQLQQNVQHENYAAHFEMGHEEESQSERDGSSSSSSEAEESSSSEAGNDDDTEVLAVTTPEQVLSKLEGLVATILEQLDNLEPPSLGNKSLYHATHCRTLTNLVLVASFCHTLLLSRRTTTTREVYYYHVTHFRSKQECDSAIWELATLLGVSRQALGLYASPKGWVCGCLDLYHKEPPGTLHRSLTDDVDGQGTVISYDLLHKYRFHSDSAKCILVIEKEGIYARLVEDRFFDTYYPCILVTGKGFPDVATRQFVQALQRQLKLPVYGLCDCNPFGVSLLHSYQYDQVVSRRRHGQQQDQAQVVSGRKRKKKTQEDDGGSDNDDSSASSTVDDDDDDDESDNDDDSSSKKKKKNRRKLKPPQLVLQWLGLRPSQIEGLNLPASSLQALTDLDKGRLRGLKHPSHPFQYGSGNDDEESTPRRLEELQNFRYKVELEALHWKGMDFLVQWLFQQLQEQENGGETCI